MRGNEDRPIKGGGARRATSEKDSSRSSRSVTEHEARELTRIRALFARVEEGFFDHIGAGRLSWASSTMAVSSGLGGLSYIAQDAGRMMRKLARRLQLEKKGCSRILEDELPHSDLGRSIDGITAGE